MLINILLSIGGIVCVVVLGILATGRSLGKDMEGY